LDDARRIWVNIDMLLNIIVEQDTFHITANVRTRRTYLPMVEKLELDDFLQEEEYRKYQWLQEKF
jgi:hypothetical protein